MSRKKKRDAGPFEALRPLKERLEAQDEESGKKPAPRAAPVPAKTRSEPADEALLLHRLYAGVETPGKSASMSTWPSQFAGANCFGLLPRPDVSSGPEGESGDSRLFLIGGGT